MDPEMKQLLLQVFWNLVFKMWIFISNLAKENIVIHNPQKSILKIFVSKKR
jgi:hypothetical protein